MSHFFDGLNFRESVGKPKINGLLKKNTKGFILKQKGTRIAERLEALVSEKMNLFGDVFFLANSMIRKISKVKSYNNQFKPEN